MAESNLNAMEALARIAEILAENFEGLVEDVNWVGVKYGIPGRLSDSVIVPVHDRRRELLNLMTGALGNPAFPRWLAEVMEIVIEPPDTNRKVARNRILGGKGQWKQALRALSVIGFEPTKGQNLFGEETLVLLPSAGGSERQEARDKLRAILAERHPAALASLQGAYQAYQSGGDDGMRQASDSVRNALENVVRDLTGKGIGPGIDEISPDDKRRRRILKALRDFLSVTGTHANQQPTERDALLGIRLAEDAITWMLQSAGEW